MTREERLPADASAAQSRNPIAVSEMQRAGVDLISFAPSVDHITASGQQARCQRYLPTYVVADFASNISNVAETVYAGAIDSSMIGFTTLRFDETRVGVRSSRIAENELVRGRF